MKRPLLYAPSLLLLGFLAVSLVVPVAADVTIRLYESKDSLILRFKNLCNAHPGFAHYFSVGKSVQGRDIWAFGVGNASSPSILWDGQMHGSEDIGSELEYMMADWLLSSGQAKLKNNYYIFIPIVNIDTTNRQNMRRAYETGRMDPFCLGVNLNRNFEHGWGWSGTSNRTDVEEYRGSYAASEPETQAMINVFKRYRPKQYVNTHMWGGPWLGYWYAPRNPRLVNDTINKYKSICSYFGVEPYHEAECGMGGYAISDANYYSACAWLLELNGEGTPPLYEVQTKYVYKVLPLLLAMSD